MSIKKTFYPKNGVYRVFFTLPESLQDHVKKVAIVGDFNEWHPDKHPMKKAENGKFQFTLELPVGKDYQFRYLLNRYKWESDMDADELAPTPFPGVYNSVIQCKLP
ncbi:MAG: isoamylase early set domain-containing protein [Bacteroidales bacterium]|nr:isoamylase early set domain-containing protein [Bacteroidales bacterium]